MNGSGTFLAVTVASVLSVFAARALGETDVKKLAGIYTPAEPAELETKAAGILADYFKKMYGVEIPVRPAGPKLAAKADNVVLVGRAALASGCIGADELEKVKYDGYVIRAKDGVIALAGYRHRGAVYAAYSLLERLGYRWYAAGCETVPHPDSTAIPDFELADTPAFEWRVGRSWQLKQSVGDRGDPRQGLNPELFTAKAGSNMWINHTSGYMIPKLLYYDEHPEYFALWKNGRRMARSTSDLYVHICVSNPDVQKIAVRRVLGWIRKQPQRRFFCIYAGDGPRWCQCQHCKAMDVQKGNYSDRWLTFTNLIARHVAKEFPDKVLVVPGYMGTDVAPIRVKPEPNVLISYDAYWGIQLSNVHPYTHPLNREALRQFEGWMRAAPDNMGIGIYGYNKGNLPSWDRVAEDIRWAAERGATRALSRLGTPDSFGPLYEYLQGRLGWDPELDPDKLKEEFVNAYFGPAAPHVLKYLATVKKRLDAGHARGQHGPHHMPAGYYALADIQNTLALFDKMEAAVAEDRVYLQRVRKEKTVILDDYLVAVRWTDKDVPRAQREHSLKILQERLAAKVARREALGDASAPEARRLEQALRGQLRYAAGVAVPKDVDAWKVAARFLDDPESVAAAYPVKPRYPRTEPEPITITEEIGGEDRRVRQGVRLLATAFEGGGGPGVSSWCSPPRLAMTIKAADGPAPSRMRAEFVLAEAPAGAAVLRFEGKDSDKDLPPKTPIRISLNETEIFRGPVRVVKHDWSWQEVPIPAGTLKAGKNTLVFENIMASARLDHYWVGISEARILWPAEAPG